MNFNLLLILGLVGGGIYALTRRGSGDPLKGLLTKAESNWQTCPNGTAYYYNEWLATDAINAAVAKANCAMHPANVAMICCKG